MVTITYDGTFEGWLTVVFEVYEYKFADVEICKKELFQPNVFNKHRESQFDQQKFTRVWKGLAAKLSTSALSALYKTFLSEEKGIENVLLSYVQYTLNSKQSIERDYSNATVLKVAQTAKRVYRESHRMEAFVRFQLTADNLYYAICQPDFNVLPLIQKHFKERYADQRWLIYDSSRNYGIYYNLSVVENVVMSFDEQTNKGKNIEIITDEKEELYQRLWQQYFASVNIAARKNMKLHIQHMPKRYWKFLPEKHAF
ncbi:TIGR03915 family putative DNA repair protein [Segetibacter aerophilus]|uniref:DNA metabolism protein n=1 Tax=Segetibacter aerophilus TaxID=670293 RepID=A0A512B728_9BACT|nr:TIGR03915 family putative DNA repair protein [Segetibacter aerophilus]GEO07771.1 DNA metabolism protein [Segetibacter aerophilus]